VAELAGRGRRETERAAIDGESYRVMTDQDYHEALRQRGYLQSAVSRFVLRDLWVDVKRRRVTRAAIKAAVVGGPALAALLGLMATRGSHAIAGWHELPILFLYFLPPVAILLFLLDLLVASLIGFVARRRQPRGRDTWLAACLVALPVLAYLGRLGWQRRSEVGVEEQLMLGILSLAVCWLLAWLAGLVSLSAMIGRSGRQPSGRPIRWFILPLTLLLLGALLAVGFWIPGATPPSSPAFEIEPVARPLVILGVDGLEGGLLQGFAREGVIDGLLDAMERSVVYPLTPRAYAEPAQVWTTMMTGFSVDRHRVRNAGVEHLVGLSRDLDGGEGVLPLGRALRTLVPTRTRPLSGRDREVPTLWEIVARKETVVAVGWWSSWPADPGGDGYLVTDRLLSRILAGGEPQDDVRPPALHRRFVETLGPLEAELQETFETGVGISDEELRDWLWQSYLMDGFHLQAARMVMADPSWGTALVYLPGLDVLRTRLDRRRAVGRDGIESLESYLRLLDQLLEPWIAHGTGYDWLLVGDPGRSQVDGESEGMLVAHGSGFPAGCVGPVLDRRALAPLVLQLRGFPRSLEMPGSAPAVCRGESVGSDRTISGYGPPPTMGPFSDRRGDPQIMERLRSLGYVN